MQVKVRRIKEDNNNLQKLLDNKNAINLSGRNSIKTNRKLRKRSKYINIATRIGTSGGMIGLCLIIIASVGSTIKFNIQVQSAKIGLVETVEAHYVQNTLAMQQGSVGTSEADQFIEEIAELYAEPEITSDYFEKLFAYIAMSEGAFQSEAFCDSYYNEAEKIKYGINYKGLIRKSPDHCTYWSIGYGTKSFRGEVITYEEGIKRKQEDIRKRDALITSTCLTENQRIAVIDFMYQHGNYASNVKYNANSCNTNYIFGKFAAWRDHYRAAKKYGMERREQLRINKFYQ